MMYSPLIAAAFLFIALAPDLPYGYYQILRWVVCACAVFGALIARATRRNGWTGIFAFIAILFNPILPIQFPREVWQPIDVVTGIIFLCSMRLFKELRKDTPHPVRTTER
jgi:uncharacterized membrane protein YccC